MKKVLALALSSVMAFSLAACGSEAPAESRPSFLAIFDSSMIFRIISAVFTTGALKIKAMDLTPPIKFCKLTLINVQEKAPPKVIITEG